MSFRLSACLLVAAVALGGCGPKSVAPAKDGSGVRGNGDLTARIERRDLDFDVEVTGDLRPSVQVDVKAEVSGKIKKILVEVGQSVKRKTPLLELDDYDLLTERASTMIEIEGAKLQLSKASVNAKRAQELLAGGLVSKQEAENLKLDADIAANNLDRAAKRLQGVEDKIVKTRIASPIDGVVTTLPVVEGQVVVGGPSVSAGTLLMTLANLTDMLISTHVNQMDVTQMREGQAVEVTVDAFEGLKLGGKIQLIAPIATIKNNIKGFAVDILVTSQDRRIRPGMSANVHIPIAHVKDVLSVPVEAVFREGKKRYLLLKNGEKIERREVEVGLSTSDRAEIKSGAQEGDVVSLVPLENKAGRS
ncbi:MAG: efflux RND transporter periplasmic adaptor subunit [Verrucomicrobiae bacterium]|nr:efflux RND transporter periplasmic adaptor subunit [Verrucomicrobiae bacterium]